MDLSINPNTIQKAYSLLEQERYIYPVKGRGNFVSDTTLLVEQTKKTLLENVSRLIANGKELGVKRAEFTQLVDRIYRKEDSHHRYYPGRYGIRTDRIKRSRKKYASAYDIRYSQTGRRRSSH